MTNINIGNKIRELRKKKGITQEGLASVLSVSPQAVSKWESGLTYPDMEMIPIIAGYFEVSMDILFNYDVREMKAKIKKIIDDAWKYFFDDTQEYIEIIKSATQEYPGNEELLAALLDAYEYALRDRDDTSHLDEMIELSEKIIAESTDFVRVCNVKDIEAAAYLKKVITKKQRVYSIHFPVNIIYAIGLMHSVCRERISKTGRFGHAVIILRDSIKLVWRKAILGSLWISILMSSYAITPPTNTFLKL
ncbi:MAG: helix-turn-helix transcriptional regulator [Clostridia bacterium]|nr:helix-turn-helix transcriptional regulator [Clostridia bacterium]